MNAPLIAFTAFAIRSQKDEIMASGADTILAKPISAREDFEVALSTALKKTSVTKPSSSRQHSEAALDPDRLVSLRTTLGQSDFQDLATEFVKDLASLRLSLSVADRDTASIRSTTHIAVSVTGAIGAQKAQSLAESLNALAHTNSIEGLDEGIADLDMALAETMTALDSFLEAS
jgi:CheY-like chemotaxis protein